MPNYRRARIAGGTYFFTVNLADRRSDLLTCRVNLLRAAWSAALLARPFRVDAVVVLPDHLHAVWTLPPGDHDYSSRWSMIKAGVSRALPPNRDRSLSKRAKREKDIWQRRFWEHAVQDDDDLARCLHYCWYNPVKHGLVACPTDWPHSSLHRDIRLGLVAADWTGQDVRGQFGEASDEGVGWASAHRR
ncbi:MAG: transposase [Pseudomonadota bacterium]